MKSPIYGMLRVEFPLLALSHCPDVVSEMLRAGGMGALGAVSLPPERLEEELAWIDDHVGGKPYGIDLIVPNKIADQKQEFDAAKLIAAIPAGHKAFTKQILERHDIDVGDLDMTRRDYTHIAHNIRESGAKEALDVAFGHPFKLIANALGFPPQSMLEAGKRHGVAVAALVSAKEHAIRQVAAGVDILVIAGGEAVGHCGDVPTMVLIPEVREALAPHGDVPILAAGGFVTGRHMAASMAMGGAGAWTGSVWLTTAEAEANSAMKEEMLRASSRDTVRSRSRTGKPSRQLRSPWTDAWEGPDSPTPCRCRCNRSWPVRCWRGSTSPLSAGTAGRRIWRPIGLDRALVS